VADRSSTARQTRPGIPRVRRHDLHRHVEPAHQGVEGLLRLSARGGPGDRIHLAAVALLHEVAAEQVPAVRENHLRELHPDRGCEPRPPEDAGAEVAAHECRRDGQAQFVDQALLGEVAVEGRAPLAQHHRDAAPAQLCERLGKIHVPLAGLNDIGDRSDGVDEILVDVRRADDRRPGLLEER